MDKGNIAGLDKVKVVRALYNGSHTQGLSVMGKEPVTDEKIKEHLEHSTYFEYFCGHVIKVDVGGDEFDPYLYDRDCGSGAAQRAIEQLRQAQTA